jgi:soluble lytic murein transglycosylase-like protein
MDKGALVALARQKAAEHGLDPALVLAVCEQESGWEPWAIRYEPEFMRRYIAPQYVKGGMTATEAWTRAMSFGLMQIVGETAREEGFEGRFLSELCDPSTGLEFGCRKLGRVLSKHPGDDAAALQAWNGGGNANYAAEVMARLSNYDGSTSASLPSSTTDPTPRIIPVHPQT